MILPENLPPVRIKMWYDIQSLLYCDPHIVRRLRISKKQYLSLAVYYQLSPFDKGDVNPDQYAAKMGVTRQAVHELKNIALKRLGLVKPVDNREPFDDGTPL